MKNSFWQRQKTAYEELGIYNFAPGQVPFQITNHARMAANYALIAIRAFGKRPFTILEMGGGSGRFAYLFLRELEERGVNVRYFLTDISEKMVLFWKTHPLFKPWIDEGKLQVAVYDPLNSLPFQEKIDLGIANHVCDAIEHDVFRVEKGMLFQGKDEGAEFFRIETAYPDFPEASQVLKEYQTFFKEATFLFPIGALRLIHSFQGKYLLIADRGEKKFFESSFSPKRHGAVFSFPGNFDVIKRFIKQQGGDILFAPSSPHFVVALLSHKTKITSSLRKTCLNLRFGPLSTKVKTPSDYLKRLREANWDPILFFFFFDQIPKKGKSLQEMKKVQTRFFPIFRQEALLFEKLDPSFTPETFKNLPLFSVIGADLQSKNLGSVLQIGKSFFAELLAASSWENYREISFPNDLKELGVFDTIFFFPPPFHALPRKVPALVREIEEKFPFLQKMVYSDQDIEEFLSGLSDVDPKQLISFFVELERKGNINQIQLKQLQKRFGETENVHQIDGSLFFDMVSTCMQHLKEDGIFYSLVFGLSPSDDPKVMAKYVVNPFISYEEREEGNGIWVIVSKLGKFPVPAKNG